MKEGTETIGRSERGRNSSTEKFKARIERSLRVNRDVMANSGKELGQTRTVKIRNDTGDQAPINLRPYSTPIHKRPLVEEAVKTMVVLEILEWSESPWSLPIVVVDKKDGWHRFCDDFRKLNLISKPLAAPAPVLLIDDILSLLGKAKYF